MKIFQLALVGFGNVNRTLVELLQRKDAELRSRQGIDWRITGIGSRRIGWRVNATGFDVPELLHARSGKAFADLGN